QVLDQCLGHAAVDVVMRHLVAHPVCGPAERQFGQVAGAQHDAAALVGEAEEVVGAQPSCTFSNVTSYTFSPCENGWFISLSISSAVAVMSMVSNVTPSASASRIALPFVRSPVAKPGRVNARMSLRGRASRSIARAATINACVESNPPDSPSTTFG